MTNSIIDLVRVVFHIYYWVVIAAVISSWLIAFHVINTSNRLVYSLVQALDALTEPVFRQVRRVIPAMGGLDLSPLIVLIAMWWVGDDLLPRLYDRFPF